MPMRRRKAPLSQPWSASALQASPLPAALATSWNMETTQGMAPAIVFTAPLTRLGTMLKARWKGAAKRWNQSATGHDMHAIVQRAGLIKQPREQSAIAGKEGGRPK